MTRYYLGLDNGGTTTKAAIFTDEGVELGSSSASTAALTPRPGYVERDMEDMWRANCDVIARLLQKTKVPPQDIAGVAVCGHGKGLYLWGKDDRPARNGIISTDTRAYAYPLAWRESGVEHKAFQRSCQHVMACQPVSLLAWIRDHEPQVYKNIRWIFECKDYIRFRLTGQAMAELTDYSGSNLLNLHTCGYDVDLLRLFGLGDILDALPPLCLSTDLCGRVTAEAAALCGLREGTPVIGGMFDIDACALGVGLCDESRLCMVAGTWSINEYLRRAPLMDGSVMMNSLFCIPDYYLIEESSATSAGNNEWFVDKLLPEVRSAINGEGGDVYEQLNGWVESIPPAEFVPVFLPFVMASNVHENAKGSFVGLNVSHTRKHMLRSVYEGVAFSHRYHLDKLMQTRDAAPVSIRLAGGVARSAVWTQMFADVMRLPIECVKAKETGALGCAIATAVAVGDYSTLEEASLHMSSVAKPVLPNTKRFDIYKRKYELYTQTINCLDKLWPDMQKLVEA